MQRHHQGVVQRTRTSSGLLAQFSAKCCRKPFRRSFDIDAKDRRKIKSGWETVVIRTVAAGTSSGGDAAPASSRATLYPAGRRQVRLHLPALILTVIADALLSDSAVVEELGTAVTAGATAVVLAEGCSTSAAQLYDAAIKLKDLLRGRAVLIVRDRTDIADAAGADGVLLSPGSLPTVVAKRMLAGGLGLVGRLVADAGAAAEAAAEGASFVVLRGEVAGAPPTVAAAAAARSQQRSSASIPIIVAAPASASATQLAELMGAGVDGLALELPDLIPVATTLRQQPQSSTAMAAAALLNRLGAAPNCLGAGSGTSGVAAASISSVDLDDEVQAALPWSDESAAGVGTVTPAVAPAAQLSRLLSASREALVEAERELLSELLVFLEEACPGMEEAALLGDALKQLDELFLLVVVGEFNSGARGGRALPGADRAATCRCCYRRQRYLHGSPAHCLELPTPPWTAGKSAVVNALLGERYLAEGILPTTNEICVLK